jgi:STAS-like domain of unknown function (DUF4325)
MVVRIRDNVDSADTADQGAAVLDVLRKVLASSEDQVVISFQGVQTATSSFVNSAFLPLLEKYALHELKRRIRVIESTRQINDMIKNCLNRPALLNA